MSNKDALDEIRELKTEKTIKEKHLGDLTRILREHPARPAPGASSEEGQAKWVAAKTPLEEQRRALVREVQALQEDITEVRKELNQAPLDGRLVSMVIDRLVEIEAIFTAHGHAEAWDRLTSLTDWLEELEAVSTEKP